MPDPRRGTSLLPVLSTLTAVRLETIPEKIRSMRIMPAVRGRMGGSGWLWNRDEEALRTSRVANGAHLTLVGMVLGSAPPTFTSLALLIFGVSHTGSRLNKESELTISPLIGAL